MAGRLDRVRLVWSVEVRFALRTDLTVPGHGPDFLDGERQVVGLSEVEQPCDSWVTEVIMECPQSVILCAGTSTAG